MTQKEIINSISLMRSIWPSFRANATGNEFKVLIEIWTMYFKDYDAKIVNEAIFDLGRITTSDFAPSIGTIIDYICNKTITTLSDTEIKDRINKAVKNSLYEALKEWEQLPEQLQKIVSPDDLYKMATGSFDSLNFRIKDIIQEYKGLITRAKEEIKIKGSTLLLGSGSTKTIGTMPQKDDRKLIK